MGQDYDINLFRGNTDFGQTVFHRNQVGFCCSLFPEHGRRSAGVDHDFVFRAFNIPGITGGVAGYAEIRPVSKM